MCLQVNPPVLNGVGGPSQNHLASALGKNIAEETIQDNKRGQATSKNPEKSFKSRADRMLGLIYRLYILYKELKRSDCQLFSLPVLFLFFKTNKKPWFRVFKQKLTNWRFLWKAPNVKLTHFPRQTKDLVNRILIQEHNPMIWINRNHS